MLDMNLIREKPEVVRKALEDRQMDTAPVRCPSWNWTNSAAPCWARWKS